MLNNKYKYALLDMSYFTVRNMFMVSRSGMGNYNAGDCMRVCFQTVNKLYRDFGVRADKFIFLADRWDSSLGGYYRTYLLQGLYKDDRVYVTEDVLEQMRQDPSVTPDEIKKAEEQCYFNKVKQEAKWTMVREFKNFGLPVLMVEGWEFDDLAWLASGMLYNPGSTEKSVIVTKDSDLMYSVSPQVDLFRTQTKSTPAQFITYDEMYQTIPDELKGKISLYGYKAYLDSLGEGHNNMRKTKKNGVNPTEAILHILQGDLSDLSDPETFKKQLETFDISKFPRLDQAKRLITDQFATCGRLGSLQEFHEFCDKYQVNGISDRYFSEFINRFDPKLFCER